MNPKEAADKLRPTFSPKAMPHDTPAAERHYVQFLQDVATELGIEHTPFHLHQLGVALKEANISPDSNEYPKMLFSRTHPAGPIPATYDIRHDHVWAHVENEDQEAALGSGWVTDHTKLPPRGNIPLYPAGGVSATTPAATQAPPVSFRSPLGGTPG